MTSPGSWWLATIPLSLQHRHAVLLAVRARDVRTKASLARLLARRVDGIFLSNFERGEIGPDLFHHACLMGLEGMVSKHSKSTYRGGRFRLDQAQEPATQRSPACRISSARQRAAFLTLIQGVARWL
jgi:hypothetical protein